MITLCLRRLKKKKYCSKDCFTTLLMIHILNVRNGIRNKAMTGKCYRQTI